MHALILAGGEGSRLRADGVATPKAFVEIGGRPLILRLLETMRGLGCESVTAAVRRSALEEAGSVSRSAQGEGFRIVPCSTPSSLHTLSRGIEAVPPGPVLCTMVDTVMREEDWQFVFLESDRWLRNGADACIAVTPHVDDETPLWVARRGNGAATAFRSEPISAGVVTGGVYFLSSRIRNLVPRVVSLGVSRMRGFLAWLVEHGYFVATVEVERIVDLDRGRDLAEAATWLGGARPS
jgi:glucose-1-phosphate thymidylyltransferase